jgi:hypothetical protein
MAGHMPGCAAKRGKVTGEPFHFVHKFEMGDCNCLVGTLRTEIERLRAALEGLMTAIECSSPDYGEDMDRARKALEDK